MQGCILTVLQSFISNCSSETSIHHASQYHRLLSYTIIIMSIHNGDKYYKPGSGSGTQKKQMEKLPVVALFLEQFTEIQ